MSQKVYDFEVTLRFTVNEDEQSSLCETPEDCECGDCDAYFFKRLKAYMNGDKREANTEYWHSAISDETDELLSAPGK